LTIAEHTTRIAYLEEEVACLKRGKKRKAILNPNRRFMALAEALASDKATLKVGDNEMFVVMDNDSEEEKEEEDSEAEIVSVGRAPESPQTTTRSERTVKKRRYR
jgi:hypothetical protein